MTQSDILEHMDDGWRLLCDSEDRKAYLVKEENGAYIQFVLQKQQVKWLEKKGLVRRIGETVWWEKM
jgi:hypothetical protein